MRSLLTPLANPRGGKSRCGSQSMSLAFKPERTQAPPPPARGLGLPPGPFTKVESP